MQIVATIRPGHIIKTEDNKFLVQGAMKMRGRYLYLCLDKAGRKVSLSREDVMEAQREGHTTVVAA